MSRRIVGISLIVIGFVLTAIGGFVLAACNLTVGDLLPRALVAFTVILPILIAGIYLYVTSNPESVDASETELQLQMMDLIRERHRITFEDLTAELSVNMATVIHLVEDLEALDLFTGYIDWGNSVIYSVRPHKLPEANP